jgi:hypothetical protein
MLPVAGRWFAPPMGLSRSAARLMASRAALRERLNWMESATTFRFLRQPNRPTPPRLMANSGRVDWKATFSTRLWDGFLRP